jgi:transcriptional regulator with XRE-family HTH domain
MIVSVPERLEQLLKHFKINQKQLSKLADLSENTISNAKKGKNVPNIDFFNNISKVFTTLNPKWLYMGEGPMILEETDDEATKNTELLEEMKDRVSLMEKEVNMLRSQIKDKEEIINLLKKSQTQGQPSI